MPKYKAEEKTLADLGEQEILIRIRKHLNNNHMSNDTALLKTHKKNIIVNTDVLVEGIHFTDSTCSAKDVGWKAVTANFSDLASSGIDQIIGITVGLIAPPTTPWEWVEDTYKGMNEALNIYGGEIAGGDCSNGPKKILAITAFGTTSKLDLQRSNAKPKDWIISTGPHGLSRLGLALLLQDPLANTQKLSKPLKLEAISRHKRPRPCLKELQTLINCKPLDLPWRAAATDSSDGLIEAIRNICNESNCQAVLDPKKIPKHDDWPSGAHWDEWCLDGGEDFELILSLPPKWAKAFLKEIPTSQLIGKIRKGSISVIWEDNKNYTLRSSSKFKHF